jgi:endonuclease YncB( thermonuclease family)
MKTLAAAFTLWALAAGAALADPCTAPLPAKGTVFTGKVRYIGDGDSLCVGKTSNPSEWIEVRVADFYAPELHSPEGPAAKAALKRIAFGHTVSCVADHRSYDRIVARCVTSEGSIGDLMRKTGVREGGNR